MLPAEIPPDQRLPYRVAIAVLARFKPGSTQPHRVQVILTRIGGEETLIADEAGETKYPTAPKGFNFNFEPISVVPVSTGSCLISAVVDETHRAAVPITFVPVDASVSGDFDKENNLIAKAHRYLRPDGTRAASGREDLKRVLFEGVFYILQDPRSGTI